jgi:hypothetical protein
MVLLYDPDYNYFTDKYGWIQYDIYRILTPNQIMLFKKKRTNCSFLDVTGKFIVRIIYNMFTR